MKRRFRERECQKGGSAVKDPPPISGQQAGGTHPTGMLSCSRPIFSLRICLLSPPGAATGVIVITKVKKSISLYSAKVIIGGFRRHPLYVPSLNGQNMRYYRNL